MEEFKVGDVVYDCVLFPDNTGKVLDISLECISVRFDSGEVWWYFMDGSLGRCSVPTLKKYKYEVEIKRQLPESGDEGLFWDNNHFNRVTFGVLAYCIKDDLTGNIVYRAKGGLHAYDNFKPMKREEFDKIREL